MINIKLKATGRGLVGLTGLTEGRISQIKANEVWNTDQTLGDALHSIVHWLGKRAAGHVSESGLDLVQERAQLAHENRETASLKNAETRGDLLRATEVRRAVFTAARSVRNSFQTVADRLSVPIAGISDHHEVHKMIAGEINQILEDMATEWKDITETEEDEQSNS